MYHSRPWLHRSETSCNTRGRRRHGGRGPHRSECGRGRCGVASWIFCRCCHTRASARCGTSPFAHCAPDGRIAWLPAKHDGRTTWQDDMAKRVTATVVFAVARWGTKIQHRQGQWTMLCIKQNASSETKCN